MKTRNNDREFSFEDKWDSIDDYLKFMKLRLVECYRTLKKTGSIYLHCDKNASHYLRVLLDNVFGMNNFRNEIIWTYTRWTNTKNSLQCAHQNIYFYSKTDNFKFNTLYTEYSASTNVDQILQERVKNKHGKSVYKTKDDGTIVFGKAKKGVPLSDVWYIPYLNPKANERVGYPTQKPILLLERIIEISTDIEDIVLDPFCGCGTSLVAAHLLGRRYIGIDVSPEAIKLSSERLENPVKTVSFLLEKGTDEYFSKTVAEMNILNSLDATPVQRNIGIDGFLKSEYKGKLVPIKIQKKNETLSEAKKKLLHAALKRDCEFMFLVRTHDDHDDIDEQLLFGDDINTNICIIDSFELSMRKHLNRFEAISENKTYM
jgi:site-specific DNA-methyltransferase (adenine-specific)